MPTVIRHDRNDSTEWRPGSALHVTPEATVIGLVRAATETPGSGYTLARGEVVLDGGNPTSITTGLMSIAAAVVTLKQATAPGDDPNAFSVDYGGAVPAGRLDVYAWKNASGTDPTQVASTDSSAVVSWIAIGSLA